MLFRNKIEILLHTPHSNARWGGGVTGVWSKTILLRFLILGPFPYKILEYQAMSYCACIGTNLKTTYLIENSQKSLNSRFGAKKQISHLLEAMWHMNQAYSPLSRPLWWHSLVQQLWMNPGFLLSPDCRGARFAFWHDASRLHCTALHCTGLHCTALP